MDFVKFSLIKSLDPNLDPAKTHPEFVDDELFGSLRNIEG
jgi:hypothetical protein